MSFAQSTWIKAAEIYEKQTKEIADGKREKYSDDPTEGSPDEPKPDDEEGSSAGVIIGIIVGVLGFLGIVGFVVHKMR